MRTIDSWPAPSAASPANTAYRPGSCNIGPAEIARRRRFGHLASAASIAALGVLVANRAPRWSRLLVAVPATGAASGYLQARLRFCAGFGSIGMVNFGELGEQQRIDDPVARARDRVRSTQIGLASVGIGLAVGLLATGLPR